MAEGAGSFMYITERSWVIELTINETWSKTVEKKKKTAKKRGCVNDTNFFDIGMRGMCTSEQKYWKYLTSRPDSSRIAKCP